MVECGWIRQRIRVETKAVANRGHETYPINEFGVAVFLFLTKKVYDDVGLAGKPARVGFARSLYRHLFGYT